MSLASGRLLAIKTFPAAAPIPVIGGFYVLVNISLVSAHPGLLLSLKIAAVGAQQKTHPFVGVRKKEDQVSSIGNTLKLVLPSKVQSR